MIISLMQLSTIDSDYIFDCFTLRDKIRSDEKEKSLKQIFADEGITKILHGGDSDIKFLITDLDIVTLNLYDTARAFSFM